MFSCSTTCKRLVQSIHHLESGTSFAGDDESLRCFMKIRIMSCPLVLRSTLGLSLMLVWPLALGAQEFGAVASDLQTLNAGHSSLESRLHEHSRTDTDGGLAFHRDEAQPVLLAQLDEPAKHASIQSSGVIAVIYPDLGEPYRSIFANIIEGIQEDAKVRVRSYAIGPNLDATELNWQLKHSGTKVVIALGRQGLKMASRLDRNIAVVVGGVLSVPEADSNNLTGISLTPDPALLFQRLKSLLPAIRRVTVIYDQHNEWLIKVARDAARAQGLELVAREARDMATAARFYEAAFAAADSRHDAVWLPQDSTTVEESTILPLVLKESWNSGVPVFSSSFLHVKKGALFALYPNNLEMGRDLTATALAVLDGEPHKRGISLLREVQTAVNLRTASHIGLNISYQQQRSFDFVFPEP
jgi:putative tryptophan/tyrosine transport system substrate-binding protein